MARKHKINLHLLLKLIVLLIPALLYAQDDSYYWQGEWSPSLFLSQVEGNRQRFRSNLQLKSPVTGGLENFVLGKDLKDSKLYVDGRLISERDFGLDLNFWTSNNAYFNIKADTFRYYYNSSNLYYADIPDGSAINTYGLDDTVYTDRGVYGFEGGMTLLNKYNVHLGYEHKKREGKTDRYTGGWIRQTPVNDWIIWEYPLSQSVDEASDKIFLGTDTTIMGYNVAVNAEWEAYSGNTDYMEPGYLQDNTLVFRRFYDSKPDYRKWLFTTKADRYFLKNKLLVNLNYQYQQTNTTSDFDIDSFNPAGARHYGEHSLNFIQTEHSGKTGIHIFDFIISAFPAKELKPWGALTIKKGNAHSQSVRGEEGAEAGAADNNPATVDERWFFDTTNNELSFMESLGIEVTGIPKTILAFSADFEQKKTRYDWDANIVEVFAGTDDGDWRWKADVNDFRSSYKISARSTPFNWLKVSTKYRYRRDISNLHNLIRNIEAKPGDPEYDASVPTNLYYPGRIGNWQRPSHKVNVNFDTKVNSRISLHPYYEFYTETFEVDGEPVKAISDYRSNTVGLSLDLQPSDNLTVVFDISNQLAFTHSRSSDFSNTINTPNATWFGGITKDFNSSSLSASANIAYQLNKYTFKFNSGFVMGKGLFDTELLNTGGGINYNLGKDTALNTAYNFYTYHEEDNGGINNYTAHMLYLSLNKKF